MSKPKKNKPYTAAHSKQQTIARLIMLVIGLVLINILAFKIHGGLDLTTDKRFTLSTPTKKMLRGMEETAIVTVFLKGEFPAGFKKLAQNTEEELAAFKQESGGKVLYKFEDPFEGKTTDQEKKEVYNYLESKGIPPMNLQRKEVDEGYSEQIIFPWALVQYNGKETPVSLLENYVGVSPQEALNRSEALLEYKFANAIHVLGTKEKTRLAYITGQDEWLDDGTSDFLTTVAQQYLLDTFDLSTGVAIPNDYVAIIINAPKKPFTEKEKFKIDQYIMRGGHVLWSFNMLESPMNLLTPENQAFVTTNIETNLDDQLFRYGARVKYNLIEDLACNPIPITAGMKGNQPNIQLRPWVYFPILQPASNHPIVKNLDGVMSVFCSSIDTIANEGVKKTILLQSSDYSRIAPSPVRVSLTMLVFQPKLELYNKPYQAAAVLLEGNYESLFKGRITDAFQAMLRDTLNMNFEPKSVRPAKQIVLGDADILSNDVSQTRGAFEMGYWRYINYRYANKTFAMNCLEYLTDSTNLLEARNKDRKLRLLDAGRVKRESSQWEAINIIVPIVMVLLFASVFLFFRKRKYEGQPKQKKSSSRNE